MHKKIADLIGGILLRWRRQTDQKKSYSGGVFNEETIFVYSAGKLIAEYSSKPPPENPTTNWTVTDQLGSPRILVNSLGEVVSRRDFLPFGEEIIPDTANLRTTNLDYKPDGVRQKFTGYQKDEETQLDFAEARMYENRHARFTAVDPLLASGKSADPQTFNRYVYVMNNPLIYTDPTGLQTATRDDLNDNCKVNCIGTVDRSTNTAHGSSGALIDLTVTVTPDSPEILETTPAALGTTITLPIPRTLPAIGAGVGSTAATVGGGLAGGACIGFLCSLMIDRIGDYTPGGIYDNTVNRTIWRDGHPFISTTGSTNTGPIDPNVAAAVSSVPSILYLTNRGEQRQIEHIARTHGISYDALSDAIHDYKESVGRRGNDNLTPETIKEIAKEVASNLSGGNK